MSLSTSFGLNLHILSFQLPSNLIKDNDDLKISITTIPEENKQVITTPVRKIKDSGITFGVNINIPKEIIPNDFITLKTEKIVVIFRRKSFFYNDPIIASSVIHFKDLPKNRSIQEQNKTINIYDPISKMEVNSMNIMYQNANSKKQKNVIGKMEIQMTLTDPFHLNEFKEEEMFDLTNNSILYEEGPSSCINDTCKSNFFGFKILAGKF